MEEKELNEIVIVEQLPVIKEKLQIISDEIDKEVNYAMSLSCNEDTKVEVKIARAKLNKIKTTLEDKRKQVKNAVMNPYNEFESVYNELVKNKLNNADEILKSRIDSIENAQKEEKEKVLREFVEEHCKANNVDIPFEKIGLNITLSASEKSLKEQAKAFIERVAADLKLIDLESLYKDEILLEYYNDYDYVLAKTRVWEKHKQLEQIQKQQESRTQTEQQEQKIEETVDEIIAPTEIEKETYQFEVVATKEQVKKLIDFMKELGVEYK